MKRSSIVSTPAEQLANVADELDSEARLVARDELRWAKHRIDALPEGQRKVVELAAIDGEGADEVTRQLHVSSGTVKSRLSRARRQLRPPPPRSEKEV